MSGRERREERRFGASRTTKRTSPTQRKRQRREELKTIRTTSNPIIQAQTNITQAKDTIKQAETLSKTAVGSKIQWGDKTYNLGTTSGWKEYKDAIRKAKSEINRAENQLTRYKTAASSAAAVKAANKVIKKANEIIGKATTVTSKQYEEQIKNIEILIKKGVAKREEGKIVLTKSPENLPDSLMKVAKKAGFDIKAMREGPSFKLFEYGKGKGERVERTTQYYATVLGAGERAVTSTLGRLYGFLTGRNVNVRTVSKDTVELVRDLSPREKRLLTLGTVGGNYLGNYAAMIPVGTAGSLVFQGAKNIVSATGAKSPAEISKIASEIAKHPNLAKAALWGPMVGIEADKIYAEYKKGTPINEIYIEIAMRGGSLLGQIQGLETGFKLPTKVKEWAVTRGKTAIPPKELWRTVTLESGELPTYESGYRRAWSKEFKDLAKELSAEKYLGQVAPNEYRVWHGTRTPFKEGIGETLAVQEGDSLAKFPGLFVAPEPSPLRLPSGAGKGYRLGLPGIGSMSEIASIDALVEVMPEGLSRAAAQSWLRKQIGTKTAYIPPVSMITAEMEAIIPPGSKLVKIGAEYYTNWAGHRVLVNQYMLIAEGVPLSMLPKGSKVVELSKLVSSAPTIAETYLTFGVVPPTSMLKKMELSSTEIKKLSEIYNIPESQVRSIIRALSSSLAEVTEDTLITEGTISTLTLKELTEVLETTEEPSIPDPTTPQTPTPEEPEPSEVTEPEPSKVTEPSPPPSTPEPLEPTPTPKLSKAEKEKRREMNLRFYMGPKAVYAVTYGYPRGKGNSITVEARSLPGAMNTAQRAKPPTRYLPNFVDIKLLKVK